MKSCKTCKYWDIYSDSWGECIKLLDWWQFHIKVETTTEYGPYGRYEVEHEVEYIGTEESFCCCLWKEDEL